MLILYIKLHKKAKKVLPKKICKGIIKLYLRWAYYMSKKGEKNMRSEKGAITLYVSIACLFVLIVGISSYVISVNKQAAQVKLLNQIESQYSLGGDLNEINRSYEGGDIIPINSLENFKKIGTGEEVFVNGKKYTFSTNATYELKTDLTYDDDYSVMINRIKNNNIVVTGGDYEVAVPTNNGTDYYVSKWNYCVPRGKVYASLYRISNDEYHLIFNASGNIARGYTTSQLVGTPEEISNGSGSTSPSSDVYISNKSWGSYSSLIKKAKVEERISPTSTEAYFVGLSAITEVEGLENIDTSNVTDMFRMFNTCTNLVSLDLSNFDTSNVQRMQGMFYNCSHLTDVNLSSFDLSSATNTSYMFSGCSSLTTLDLSSFIPEHTTNMQNMFRYCSNLTTIYVSEYWTTDAVTSSTGMFKSCTSLVGVIPFDSSTIDKTHANWETGYLTLKVIISYNANGGTGTMQSTITPTVAANGFTPPSGLSFKEWNTQANGNGISYAPGDRILSNMRLYAIWGTPSVDANGFATENTTITTSTTNVQIVIPTGFAPAILNGSDSTTSNPGQDGSVKSIMPAANWSNITAAQINAGVVIKNAAGEEFVWVPIPNSSNFARTAWTWTYNNQTNTQTLAEPSTSSAYWDDKTTTEYTNMVSSVNSNKGFYISRYEASNNGSSVAQSKRGVSPWVEVAQTAAITASSNNSISNTHLMYGIEWDSVLNWLIGKATIGTSTAGQTKTMESADVTDSRSWGNHSNSTGDAATNSGSLRTTTHNEYWKANNIYDLAGNVFEWTQEKYSTGTDRANRGGSCDGNGANTPAASRYRNYETGTYGNRRFPFQLLLVALDSGSDVA